MSKFIKSSLSGLDNVLQPNSDININTNSLISQDKMLKETDSDTVDLDLCIDLDDGSSKNKNSVEQDSTTIESIGESYKKFGATIAVGTTSILSGVAKVEEYVGDGLTWVGGKAIEGGSWLVGEIAGLFSDDAKDSIMDWREDTKTEVKDFIDRDRVGELNEWFYEDTEIGQAINEASYLKYDSEVAQTMQNVTVKITELAAATALTFLTGGAAAPVAFAVVFGTGFAEGIGKTAEATYQNGGDFDDGTLTILLSGGLNGLSWYTNGKLGQGAINIMKDAASVGLLETGSTLLNDTILNKEFWINSLKNGLSLKTLSASGNSVINVNALMNYGASLLSIGGDFVDVLNSDEGFTPENIMVLGAKYLAALGLNVLEDSGREYISSYKAGDIASGLSQKELTNTEFEEVPNPTSATIGRQTPEKIDTTDLEKALEKSGVAIYSKGIDINATAKQIPINYLLKIVEDPDYTTKVLDGYLLDEIDGMTRLEIGNALQDLKKAISDNNLDLGLDEASLARMDDCIRRLSANPIMVLESAIRKMSRDATSQNYSFDYFISEDGQKMVKYLEDYETIGSSLMLPDGYYVDDVLEFYQARLINAMMNDNFTPSKEQFLDIITRRLNKDSMSNEEVRTYLNIMKTNNYYLFGDYGDTFAQYVRRANLEDAEQITAERLRAFTEGYVSDEKVNTIYGSCIYETNAQFALHNHPNWMAYNNGQNSVMNLSYPEDILRANVNHESIHQLSSWFGNFDSQTGARISKSGVKYSLWDAQNGEWINSRTGFNECITELFNKMSMESEYPTTPYCGYQDGVEKLEGLIDTGIIDTNELKRLYFNNLGEELIGTLNEKGANLGLGQSLGDDLSKLFDGSISNEASERANSLNQLTRIITDIYAAQENKINPNSSRGFASFIKKIFK